MQGVKAELRERDNNGVVKGKTSRTQKTLEKSEEKRRSIDNYMSKLFGIGKGCFNLSCNGATFSSGKNCNGAHLHRCKVSAKAKVTWAFLSLSVLGKISNK